MSTKDYLQKDYYAALGVPKDAAAPEIKKAYRKLARQYHPDANTGDAKAEARFKEISEAYDVLSDTKRRKEYDDARLLFAGGRFGGGRPGPGTGPAGGGMTFDINDLIGDAGRTGAGANGGFGDLFGGLFGQAGRRASSGAPRRGQDLESQVTLSFADAVEGVTVPLRLTTPATCNTCSGTGAKPGTTPRVCPNCTGTGMNNDNQGSFAFAEPCRECRGRGMLVEDPCRTCLGSGTTPSERTLTVRIPAGVADGQKIRLKGKGSPGQRGAPSGDLIVSVQVTPHPVFGRSADNLTVKVPVTFAEAALGATIKVPTLGGQPVSLKLASGSTSGRTLRVRGKGVPRRDGTRGDLLVTIDIAVPQKLSAKAREALETFAAEASEDPRASLLEVANG